jgi:hypothetical protein
VLPVLLQCVLEIRATVVTLTEMAMALDASELTDGVCEFVRA